MIRIHMLNECADSELMDTTAQFDGQRLAVLEERLDVLRPGPIAIAEVLILYPLAFLILLQWQNTGIELNVTHEHMERMHITFLLQ